MQIPQNVCSACIFIGTNSTNTHPHSRQIRTEPHIALECSKIPCHSHSQPRQVIFWLRTDTTRHSSLEIRWFECFCTFSQSVGQPGLDFTCTCTCSSSPYLGQGGGLRIIFSGPNWRWTNGQQSSCVFMNFSCRWTDTAKRSMQRTGGMRRRRMFSAIMNYHLNSRTATASRGALIVGGCEAWNQMKIRSRFFIVKYYNSSRRGGGRRDTKSRLHLSVAAMALITLIIFIFFSLSHWTRTERGIFSRSAIRMWVGGIGLFICVPAHPFLIYNQM